MNSAYSIDGFISFVTDAVKVRAKKHFLMGRYKNPYPESPVGSHRDIKGACRIIYHYEIERLKNERLCPCCGQTTMGDISCRMVNIETKNSTQA